MRTVLALFLGVVLGAVVFAAASPAAPAEGAAKHPPKVQLKEKSATVFPVLIVTPAGPSPVDLRQRIAEVVGMLLERAGLDDVRLAKSAFTAPDGASVEKIAAAFGRFVVEQKIETPYALYGELLGEPGRGVDAVRTIVVDRQGNVAFAEEMGREAIAKLGPNVPNDPLECCVFMVNRLRAPWDLADPLRKDAPRGKIQEDWRQKSGLPDDDEIKAMGGRAGRLRQQLAESRLVVLGVRAGGKADEKAASLLAEELAPVGFKSVVAAEAGPMLDLKGSPNEQEVLWRAARQVRTWVQQHKPQSEYVLVADFAIGRTAKETKVAAVHWIVCDRQGDWVLVDYQNSHHADFQQVAPKSVEDCVRLVEIRLKKRLQETNNP